MEPMAARRIVPRTEEVNMSATSATHRRDRRAKVERNRNQRACRVAVESLENRSLLTANTVVQWNQLLLDAIRVDRTPPPLAARNMAMVQVAVFDSVNAIDRRFEAYRVHARAPRSTSPEAAAAAAAHRVLVQL